MNLHGVRILVADDQRDVAVTLTSGLREAGAALTYVTDGEAALTQLQMGGFDALLLDMKMPPEDWGGLWVLGQMRQLELTVPTIVLSGEGGQRQTIEAMRLGARDWVDKGSPAPEILDRCAALIDDSRRNALRAAAGTLPTPVAHDFERLAAADSHDRIVTEGLRALEGTARFAAVVALADCPASRGIQGMRAAQLARPSLGTWVSVARGFVAQGDPTAPAATWLAALLPERSSMQTIQNLIALRNDVAHGGIQPTEEHSDAVRARLIDVAHRLSTAWRWKLHVVTSLEYDGTKFAVQTRLHSGTSSPTASAFDSHSPVRTGDVVLVDSNGRCVQLAPWLALLQIGGSDVVAIYDSARLPGGGKDAETPLGYIDPASRQRGLTARSGGATWSDVCRQFGE